MTAATDHLSESELLAQLEKARKKVEIGALYLHYRNPTQPYKVLDLAIIEATQEVGVIYRKENGSKALQLVVWIRPLSSFLEKIPFEGKQVERFKKI